ncbi:MAG: hypothetical protein AABY74_04765, partial [Planctomycetota bacterium]
MNAGIFSECGKGPCIPEYCAIIAIRQQHLLHRSKIFIEQSFVDFNRVLALFKQAPSHFHGIAGNTSPGLTGHLRNHG